jgi:enamine deaminase RidA (YjgF/YER057c/UK114 family)
MKAIRINPATVWRDEAFPFNQAVVEPDGRRVHLTGQVAWDAAGRIITPGDPEGQAKAAIENISLILAELGGALSDIVAMTVYFRNDADLPAIQRARRCAFEKATGPAVTAIKVVGFVDPDLLVEMTATAVIPHDRFQAPLPGS